MVSLEDKRGQKFARHELARRGIDVTRGDVRVTNGICTIRGLIGRVSGSDPGLGADLQSVAKVLRQRSGIREVVLDVSGNLL